MTAPFASYSYLAADHVTALTLTAAQQSTLETALVIVPAAGNTDNGSASWTYNVADSALDFLAQGQTLTLTYTATVNDHSGGIVTQPITVTITGTNDAPVITAATSNAFVSGNATTDTVGGTISFTDVDLSDRPTVTAPFASYSYLAADHVTALTLTAAQQSAVETALVIVPAAGNTDNGSASWTYSVADSALNFLAQGETLTLTYTATVNDHSGGIVTQPITITIGGTDNLPVITAATSNAFSELPGTNNATTDTVGGTVSFTDVDLSDRPTVTAPFASYSYLAADHVTALTLTAAQQSTLETALVIVPAAGNTDNGSASWTYNVADSALDFLAQGQTLTLTYTATVNDHSGGIVTQPITVTITGTNDAPVITAATSSTTKTLPGATQLLSTVASLTLTDVDPADGEPFLVIVILPPTMSPALTLTAAQAERGGDGARYRGRLPATPTTARRAGPTTLPTVRWISWLRARR